MLILFIDLIRHLTIQDTQILCYTKDIQPTQRYKIMMMRKKQRVFMNRELNIEDIRNDYERIRIRTCEKTS